LAKAGAFDWLIGRKTVLNNIDKILNWIKNLDQTNQSFWLFGWQIDTKLDLKEEPETLMDKLTLEFELFKTFVSAHPFDWLFKWIKWKYNFISMFKWVEDYWEFKILW
jgi:DNA polymerase III alpha subunit